MRTVAVIGIGETRIGRHPDSSLRDLIREAGNHAIEDAGIDRAQLGAAYVGNFNAAFLSNQSHLGPMVSEELGLGLVPTMRVEGACASGSLAFLQGCLAIQAGLHDVVLVGGVEKMCHQPTDRITAALASAMDQELEASYGLTFPGSFALIATRYFHEYRNVKREMGQCAVIAHHNATLNPDAQLPKELDLDKVLGAELIADPLSLYDCSLTSDGAAFAVLTTAEFAASLGRHRVVEVAGSGHAGDTLTLYSKPSITSFPATRAAAAGAYGSAGLGPSDVDFAEVHDCFTITQLINTEDLGFFEPGTGGNAVAGGWTTLEGRMPINPSGGLKAKGHPVGATGISQIFEVVTQLRGDAGARQLPRADIGLTHNLGGSAATAVVNIFRGR